MPVVCPRCDVAPDVSATAGSTCRSCGTALILRERKRRTSALDGIVTPPPQDKPAAAEAPLDLPPMLELDVVDLGVRTGTAPATPRISAPQPVAEPPPLAELAPEVDDAPLELDADWQREKAARQAAPSAAAQRTAATRPKAASGGVPWILLLVVAAGLCAGGYYLMTR